MTFRPFALLACAGALLVGCASQPDHFYTLDRLPGAASPTAAPRAVHVILETSVPALNDRSEMVVTAAADRILVLEHERWAAPLSDLVQQTLAGDLERRRADVLVADRRFDRPGFPPVTVKVDIVHMAAEPGRGVTVEAQWRIVDARTGTDQLGSGVYAAPLVGDTVAPMAHAYSVALGELADALTAALPPP